MSDAVALAAKIRDTLAGARHIASQAHMIEISGHLSTEAATVRDNARLRIRDIYEVLSSSIGKAVDICEDTIMRDRLLRGDYSPKPANESNVAVLPPLTIGDDAVTVARVIDHYLAASFVELPAEIRAEFDLRALSIQIVDGLNNKAHGMEPDRQLPAKARARLPPVPRTRSADVQRR